MNPPRQTAHAAGAAPSASLLARAVLALALVVALAMTACTSQSRAKADAQHAFVNGQQQGAAMQKMAQEPSVFFKGAIRNPRIPWSDDLTLAQALLAAEYTGLNNPLKIDLIRQGNRYSINVRRLLRGTENPLLEPGDVVEIAR